MNLINKAHAMPPPDEWPENKVECAIHGKILYQWKISEAECENYWLTIVRDENYKYYNIVTATPKDYYQMFHESPDGKGPVTVTHEACPASSKKTLNNEDYYHFTIRKHYVHDNFAIETDTGSTDAWKKLPTCSWNLIDQAALNTTQTNTIKTQENVSLKKEASSPQVCRLHGSIQKTHFNFKNDTIQEGSVVLEVQNNDGESFFVLGKAIRYPLYTGDPFFEEGKVQSGDPFSFLINPATHRVLDFSYKAGAIQDCKPEYFSQSKILSFQDEMSFSYIGLIFSLGFFTCFFAVLLFFFFKKFKYKK